MSERREISQFGWRGSSVSVMTVVLELGRSPRFFYAFVGGLVLYRLHSDINCTRAAMCADPLTRGVSCLLLQLKSCFTSADAA
jgi:hypothetical protein